MGTLLSGRARAHPRELARFVRLFTVVRREIEYALRPTGDLLHRLALEAEFSDFAFLQTVDTRFRQGEPLSDAWDAAVLALQTEKLLKTEEIALIQAFCSAFGSTDPAGQSANCAYFIDRLSELQKGAAEAAGKKSRLYLALGVLGGVFAVLILL